MAPAQGKHAQIEKCNHDFHVTCRIVPRSRILGAPPISLRHMQDAVFLRGRLLRRGDGHSERDKWGQH